MVNTIKNLILILLSQFSSAVITVKPLSEDIRAAHFITQILTHLVKLILTITRQTLTHLLMLKLHVLQSLVFRKIN